jgi:nucleolin
MGTNAQDSSYDLDWNKSICSTLTSSDVREVKKLRKLVLLSLQLDGSDKTAKKSFKRAVKQLEEDGTLTLDADGTIKMKEKKKRKSEKKEKSKKKKKRKTDSDGDDDLDKDEGSDDKGNSQESGDQVVDGGVDDGSKNDPCVGNAQGITRLFLGNLPFTIDESSLNAFLPGEVTHIKWITDKETGKFYGSAFIEIDNSKSAAEAVGLNNSKLIGRPIKINFAQAREGDVWPPVKKVVSGGGQAGGSGIKAMSAKPEGCLKLFIGNLSYDIDDDGIIKFFDNVDAEVKAVRWLHHKDTGDFKGWYVSSIE